MCPPNKHRTTAQGHHRMSLANAPRRHPGNRPHPPRRTLPHRRRRRHDRRAPGRSPDAHAYDPQTEDELRLAANIIGFSFQALEALSQAATPDMPLTRTLRLRGGAVSLSRESHKAQRRLDKLQAARRAGIRAETQPEPPQPEPKIEKALDLIDTTRKIAAAARPRA